ncbi:Asp-tRNA(Asn)/Glu-tRNA(Gln) amidotransferase subunit GatC [Patescibacteria group bacterium]
MEISKKDVKNLSILARVGIDDKEIEPMQKDLEKILEFVSKLKSAKTSDVDAKTSDAENLMREDKDPHKSGEYTEDLLNQAPNLGRGFVKVKKVFND